MNYREALKKTREKFEDCLAEDEPYYTYIHKFLLGRIGRQVRRSGGVKEDLTSLKNSLKHMIEKIEKLEKDV